MTSSAVVPRVPVRGLRARAALAAIAASTLCSLPGAAAGAANNSSTPVWEAKIALSSADTVAQVESPALCWVNLAKDSSELRLSCRHELGANGEVTLVRGGSGARSEPPLWSAPLASPFEAVATLDEAALELLFAGELALRIDTGAAGVAAEGSIPVPIFTDGFDTFSMCRWSNYPCPSDGNVCTTETCSPTGVCGHQNNANACPLPNATGGCAVGVCGVIVSCNDGYSHCDSSQLNGCEVAHDTNSGSCAGAAWVAAHGGDLFCDGFCAATYGTQFANRTGIGEAWFEARADENSNCTANLRHDIYLTVPDGIDFDLYVYRNCQLVGSSEEAAGYDEHVTVTQLDYIGYDDFYYQVEVRYYSGHSCDEWSLDFMGRTCDP